MRNRINPRMGMGRALMTLAALSLLTPVAQAQLFHKKCDSCAPPCYTAPSTAAPTTPETPAPPMTAPLVEPSFTAEQAAAGSLQGFTADSGVGYIDSAIIRSQFRFRFDAAYHADRPDRAEFIYPKCGCFRINGIDPDAAGPPPGGFNSGRVGADFDVNFQEYTSYLELAVTNNLSGFIEVPYRGVDFSIFPYEDGFGDLNFGFKAALINNYSSVQTFQFRTYVPTGEGDRGLGTEHVSLEPAFLSYNRLSERWIMEAELRYWIPIDGSDFAGDVLRYGLGLTYVLVDTCKCRVLPVAEVVAWSVLNGNELTPTGIEPAGHDTIVNGKLGVRFGFGNVYEPGLMSGSEFYIGYGRALTGDVWYEDIVRIEYRMPF